MSGTDDPDRPAVFLRHAPAAPAETLRQVRAGVEEEGVPLVVAVTPAGGKSAVVLAHLAARWSRLETGIGVDDRGSVVVHHATLPLDRPAFVEACDNTAATPGPSRPDAAPPPRGRSAGAAAARVVTGLPLPCHDTAAPL